MAWTKRKTGGSGSPARGAGAYEEEEKVPRGHVPMLVADGDGGHGERVLVPVTLLSDPSVAELPGVLRVPCDAGHFRQVLDGAMHRCGISVA
jgi:SAUR family protein